MSFWKYVANAVKYTRFTMPPTHLLSHPTLVHNYIVTLQAEWEYTYNVTQSQKEQLHGLYCFALTEKKLQ